MVDPNATEATFDTTTLLDLARDYDESKERKTYLGDAMRWAADALDAKDAEIAFQRELRDEDAAAAKDKIAEQVCEIERLSRIERRAKFALAEGFCADDSPLRYILTGEGSDGE